MPAERTFTVALVEIQKDNEKNIDEVQDKQNPNNNHMGRLRKSMG
jgi:hypothetical protein